MNSKLLSIIAVLIGILLPMKMQAQWVANDITAPMFTFEGDNIVMTCETQGANIYYVMSEFANEDEAYSLSEALDVSEANSMRTLYTQPFPVTSNVVIKAVAKMPQQQGESEVTTLIYSYTAWSGLLSAIEYGSKVQERAKDSPLVSDDLKERLQWALEEGQMIYGYRGQMPDSHEAEHFAEEILEIAHQIEEILNQQPVIAEVMLTGKNANYWYDETGTDPNGDEAVVFTLPENPDGGNFWEVNVLNTFIRNQLAFTTPDGEAVENITGEILFESKDNMVAINDGKMLMYESADEQGEIAMIEPGMGMMRIINNEITQRLLNEPNSQFMALPVNVMAYQDGKEVPVINGRFTVLVRLEKQQKEPEPYAVLSQNNTVLTFYYDDQKAARNGMSVGPFEHSYDQERNRDVINSGWDEQRENITIVVFDDSFANCTSITSTAYWFYEFRNNLTTITGISNLNTANVTDMTDMFFYCARLSSLDVTGFNTAKVTSMEGLFMGCNSLTSLNVSGFNTANVTNMNAMFFDCRSLRSLDLGNFNTSNVTNMNQMFVYCSNLASLDITSFNTTNVMTMARMFEACESLRYLDLTSFNTENVVDMSSMFDTSGRSTNLRTIYVGNGWTTDKVGRSDRMFLGCTRLVGGAGTQYNADHTDHAYAHIDGGTDNPGYLTDGNAPRPDPEPEAYVVFSQNRTVMTFYYDYQRDRREGTIYDLNQGYEEPAWGGRAWDVRTVVFDDSFADYRPTSTCQWFDGVPMTEIQGFTNLNTSEVTNMHRMFTMIGLNSLDLSHFNTEKVTDMSGMFYGNDITSIDVSSFNTSNVTDMSQMFYGCNKLTSLDISHFNTENVTNLMSMFNNIGTSTLDLSHFNTSKVTNMADMFANSDLTTIDISNFDTRNVTDMGWLFSQCYHLVSIDMSGFNTSKVTDMSWMFHGCEVLTTVYVGNDWTTSNVTETEYIFSDCFRLVGGRGTQWSTEHRDDIEYARIDGGPNNPGYFTDKNAPAPTDAEPYAVLSRNSTVMTFYYDDQMAEKGGISLDDDRWEGRERELSSSIVALVFDESFSDFVVNEVEDFSIDLTGWTSLAAVRAGSVRIPAEEYAKVGNPNLLVYVDEPSLAPQGVQNVVVNGVAQEIVLTNATEGNNNWHCPEPFRAERITYTRNFRQQTEVGISRGWESIALPFTVQTITHEAQGQIIPFGAQGTGKYFWLRGYSPEGLHRATVLEANTPYVISMPNNPTVYPSEYNLNGRVTFSAENTTVPATPEFEEMLITRGNITMAPIFVAVPRDEAVYAINVSQPLDRYAEGSVFTRELREVRPFEAATTHEPINGARPKHIRIAPQPDDDVTGIRTIELDETEGTWYSLDGRQLQGQPQRKGVYLQKGKKVVIK